MAFSNSALSPLALAHGRLKGEGGFLSATERSQRPQHLLNFKFDPHGQGAFLPILWLAHTSCLGFNLRERASSSGSGSHGFLVNVATSIIFLLPELLPILSHWFACN